MADVFLSYSQRDRRRVQSVIRSLEAAGLSVWWDRRILGGSEFSKEIRDALDGAAAVVVLWSERSVTSSWVLDEAVRGRDTGRLVPASLDGTEPPLGFGQLHTVDLSKRFRSTGALGELVEAVLAKVAHPGAEPPLAAGPRFRLPRGVLLAAVAAAVLALAAAAYLLLGERAPSDRFKGGTVAIEHFEALTPDRQSELAARLVEQSVERIFATNFIETVTAWTAPKTALAEADFGLRGTIDRAGDSLRATVDVIDPKSGRTLWSSASSRKASEARQLGDQLAISVADILRCAIYTKRRIPQYSSPELFSRILRICEFDRSGFSQIGQGPNVDQALIEIAPKSAQAHALLANDLALQTGDESSPADLARVRAAIASTLALDPDNGAVLGHGQDRRSRRHPRRPGAVRPRGFAARPRFHAQQEFARQFDAEGRPHRRGARLLSAIRRRLSARLPATRGLRLLARREGRPRCRACPVRPHREDSSGPRRLGPALCGADRAPVRRPDAGEALARPRRLSARDPQLPALRA